MINWASSNRMAHQISFKKAQSLYKFDRHVFKSASVLFFQFEGNFKVFLYKGYLMEYFSKD